MKSDKLKLYIRKMVREEVAMAIHEVITELKRPSLSSKQPVNRAKKRVVKNEVRKWGEMYLMPVFNTENDYLECS